MFSETLGLKKWVSHFVVTSIFPTWFEHNPFTRVFVSCKRKNSAGITKTMLTVFEYEFLITAVTKAKSKRQFNRYNGCFHENLSGRSSYLQTDTQKSSGRSGLLLRPIQSKHRPFIKFTNQTTSADWPEQNNSVPATAVLLYIHLYY